MRPGVRALLRMALGLAWLGAVLSTAPASAAGPAAQAPSEVVPRIDGPPSLAGLADRPIRNIEVQSRGTRWSEATIKLGSVRVGDLLTPELARRALLELTDTGRYASAEAEVEASGDGVVLRLWVVPLRIVSVVKLNGGVLDDAETRHAAGVDHDQAVTEADLPRIAERLRALYQRRGYPAASVTVDAIDTDDPLNVVLAIDVVAGAPLSVGRLRFRTRPHSPALSHELGEYPAAIGDRVDQEALTDADRRFESHLRAAGWHRASVRHEIGPLGENERRLTVIVRAGPRYSVRFEGQRVVDAEALEEALALAEQEDRAPATLVERLRAFYAARGFLDSEISVREVGGDADAVHDLVFSIKEQPRVVVTERSYPCLTGARTPTEVGSEIDSYLSEALPGADLFGSADPLVLDETLGPTAGAGTRVVPDAPNPWRSYVPDVYEKALKHVQDLYRSEGYLSASVGPARLVRRQCDARSPAGQCRPLPPRRRAKIQCQYDEIGLPLDEPPFDGSQTCTPDPARGVRCEPRVLLEIPIKLGPRTQLYDVGVEGNRVLIEKDLEAIADLPLGDPLSMTAVEKARRRVVDAYAEEGFAFAEVETELDFSPDRTRARVRFVVSERERVKVSAIVVRGARNTHESLVLRRVALRVGDWYRRSLVRKTEERLATLGVFASVTVGFEDPYVPAKEKVVLITVQERPSQYLDIRPGFSTGEGFRVGFEYGHRNLASEAIALTLRVQLGYLPPPLVIEPDVRRKYEELDVGSRLQRRNSARLEFPEVGLGPLFRLTVEGIDVRDNARDFGLTKDAGIVTLGYRPDRHFSFQIGGSLERNVAQIFGDEEKGALSAYVQANQNRAGAFRVPEGTTFAKAERAVVTWDRRDNPFDATQGTLLSGSVEHVRADPVGDSVQPYSAGEVNVFAPTTSQFLRMTGRVAGYVRLSDHGLAVAMSFRAGYNHQLLTPCRELAITAQALGNCSQTYPDRLFFLGGVDSLRGFPQDSMVPQDVAEKLLDPQSGVELNQVVVRGGDLFVNPRLELRIPLGQTVQTALFIDSGNLWIDPRQVQPFNLRYAVGSGVRINTPIGPLVFDYGFNLARVLDGIDAGRSNQRYWEDLGAFHFSIGLF